MKCRYVLAVSLAVACFAAAPAWAADSQIVKDARVLLASNPNDDRTLLKVAEVFYKEGLHNEAVTLWGDLMKLKPQIPEPHYFMGKAQFHKGRNLSQPGHGAERKGIV